MFQETYQIEFPDVDFMGNVKADVLFSGTLTVTEPLI